MTDTETSILAAAQNVFLRKGLAGANMGDIAREAHISRPALHYYHRTKHALFQAILAKAVESIIPKITSVVTSDLPALEKASQILDHYHLLLLEHPLLPHFLVSEIHRDPKALLDMLEKHREVGRLVERLQQQHASELKLARPPRVAIVHFFCTIYGLLFFPFLIKPLLDGTVFTGGDAEAAFSEFVGERKTIVLSLLAASLKTPQQSATEKPAPAKSATSPKKRPAQHVAQRRGRRLSAAAAKTKN
jgi:AcrR family transcriptional regulator